MEDSIAYDIAKKGCSIVEHRRTGNIGLTGVQSKTNEIWLIIIEMKLQLKLKVARGGLNKTGKDLSLNDITQVLYVYIANVTLLAQGF